MKDEKDDNSEQVTVTNNKTYSLIQKLICCRCFSCCQQKNILTSNIRKRTLKRMLTTYVIDQGDDRALYDPVQLMILIYLCEDDKIPQSHIKKCRIFPNVGISTYRTDLEFYIPQMCNYIVFYRDLKNSYLREALEAICKVSLYFAHLYCFYMQSIEANITKSSNEIIKPVKMYNEGFMLQMENLYAPAFTALDLFGFKQKQYKERGRSDVIKSYGTKIKTNYEQINIKAHQIELLNYKAVFCEKNKEESTGFSSTLDFFKDLFVISEDLKQYPNKKQKLIQFLAQINHNLPAAVYIPFSKNSYRICNVLKIILSETRLFSTKERAPFCICVEMFCPAQKLSFQQQEKFWEKVQLPYTLKVSPQSNISEHLSINSTDRHLNQMDADNRHSIATRMSKQQKIIENIYDVRKTISKENIRESFLYRDLYSDSINTEMNSERDSTDLKNNLIGFFQNQQKEGKAKIQLSEFKKATSSELKKRFQKLFGEELFDAKIRLAQQSIFGNLFSWDIVHLIIKTNDDLKQQQFALQLIYQFDYIFKLQKLPLILTPYEVLSMGPDCGIIEMVKDSVTFDSLKKNLFECKCTLNEFFQIYFKDNLAHAKDTFMKSLVAYSLVMYFIQAKDRHNGNILLHRSGKMFHIDFGFFLSNMPGKGIQLQKDCPFKLLSEHVEVLGGTNSYYFSKFREYFFLGFKAVKKHQNKILMLVKMMYSSAGLTMPCFQKGEQAIKAMQSRINPPLAQNDPLLNNHCQKLINLSLDNWASRWYDRFQYWAQGIFY